MTKKDFELIARAIRSAPLADDYRADLADHFASVLAEANPLFDRGRFVAAADPGPRCEECGEPLGDEPVVRHETGDYHARCALADPTEAQRAAIEAQALVYGQPETPCAGLSDYTVQPASEWEWDAGVDHYPEGSVAVQFRYLYEADREGLGLEVTVFDRDGKVIDSQDFG